MGIVWVLGKMQISEYSPPLVNQTGWLGDWESTFYIWPQSSQAKRSQERRKQILFSQYWNLLTPPGIKDKLHTGTAI